MVYKNNPFAPDRWHEMRRNVKQQTALNEFRDRVRGIGEAMIRAGNNVVLQETYDPFVHSGIPDDEIGLVRDVADQLSEASGVDASSALLNIFLKYQDVPKPVDLIVPARYAHTKLNVPVISSNHIPDDEIFVVERTKWIERKFSILNFDNDESETK